MSAQSLEQFRAFRREQEERRNRRSLVRRASRLVVRRPKSRLMAALVVAVVVILTGTVAVAAWLSMGTGAGAATATTVNQASAPTVVMSGNAADISWNPVTLASGVPVSGYRVQRHVGDTVTTVCTTTEPTRSCSDNAPTGGLQQYGVVAARGSWSGPESDLTSLVGDTTAPTTTIERTPAPNGGGWNRADVEVTLTATDSGTGLSKIHYTVNGVETAVAVSGASAEVDFVVSREDANALTFWSVDNAGNAGAPSSTQFVKVDKTAPVTTPTVTSQGSLVNGWYDKAASVALDATDTSPFTGALASGLASMQYQVGGTAGSWLSYSDALSVGDGVTTVYYRSTDVADNVEDTRSREVKVDSTPPTLGAPTTQGGTAGSNGWYVGSTAPVVKVAASDATSGLGGVDYQVGGGSWIAYDAESGVSVPESTGPAGTELRFRATDVAGNVTTSPVTAVRYDRSAPSAPTVAVNPGSNDGSNGYYRTAPKVTGSASTDAASGVDSYEYRLNGGAWTSAASPYAVPDGSSQVIGVRAVDRAGNATAAVTTDVLRVDTVNPTASATVVSGTPGQNDYYTSNPTVRFTGSDAQGSGLNRLEYSTNGGASWTTVASNDTVLWNTQGATTFTTRATDVAGNVHEHALSLKVDTQLPTAGGATVSPTAPDGLSGWYKTKPSVTLGNGSDPQGGSGVAGTDYQFGSTSGSGWLAFATQLLIGDTGPAGTTLYWTARDGAGNRSDPANSLNFKVDSTKPSTGASVSSGAAGSNGWYKSMVDVLLTPTDTAPGSGVSRTEYQVTTSSSVPTSWSGATAGTMPRVTNQGTSYVWYRSTDVAGNVEGEKKLEVMIDSTAPVVSVTSPASASYSTNNNASGWARVCGDGSICANVSDTHSAIDTTSATFLLTASSGSNLGKCWTGPGSGWIQGSACAPSMTVTNGVAKSTAIPRSSMSAGNYTVTVSVKDRAGNTATSAAISFSTT